jgi:WD40 repeat protein/serine/threonine protein kinase
MKAPGPDVKAIFNEALDRPNGRDREVFLDRACQGDAEMRARVETLLRAHEQADGFLESPAPALSAPDGPSSAEVPGTAIGLYKLLEQIGEGGMGIVYLAEQTQPVRRRVALKLIKPGMDTRQVIARFEAERQALALMDHPNIARVFDAGATESGRPYFVMELVRGVPITDYCDRERLPIPKRLDLFVQVCQAVQHAHQKGIIHRDLKPSNVLVTLVDGIAVPKVIDFGVAKATGPQLTERTLYTAFAQLVGTPLYMSPEQAALTGTDIDTRSDIYSLGVLLYELLTGTTPFDREALGRAAWDEFRRLIRESEPPAPSMRLSSLGETLTTVSANRRTDPGQLSRSVRGELDWIVLKALEKDRGRRYETANALARDIQRHLADQPVEACPPSGWYRFGKFARRHRAALATGVVVAASLVAATVVCTWQALRARTAERHAETALGIARLERGRADEQRILATQQRDLATAKTREATEQARKLEWQLYVDRVNRAYGEWQANNVAEAEQLLDDCPVALRGWEWRYVKRLCHLDLLTYRGHTRAATGVAFSPDGTKVISVSGGGFVSTQALQQNASSYHAVGELAVWDSATGREIFTRRGLKGGIQCVAVSPDGTRIVSGNRDGGLTVWDAATGREVLVRPGEPVLSVAFSPDGKRVAAGYGRFMGRENVDGGCVVTEVATGTEVLEIPVPQGSVQSLAFSPDGTRLAIAGMQLLELWDLSARQRLKEFRGHTDLVCAVAFRPDGRRLASASLDDTVRLWEVETGAQSLLLRGPTGGIYSVAFSPDGRRVAASGDDRSVMLWDAETGEEQARFRGHTTFVLSVAFSPDGTRLASACNDGLVKIWDVAMGQAVAIQSAEKPMQVSGVAFSPDGTQLATHWNEQILGVYAALTGAPRFTLPEAANDVAFSPDGTRLAAAGPGSLVTIRDATNGRALRTLQGHIAAVQCVAFSPDGTRLASAGDDSTVRLWDPATGRELQVLSGHVFPVSGLAFSPDGHWLASASDICELNVWDVTTGQTRFTRRRPRRAFTRTGCTVAFSTDSRHIAWADFTTVEVCDAASGQELFTLRGHTARVLSVAYSPDGSRIASASRDRTVKLWDAASGAEVFTLRGHVSSVHDLAFSGDGRRLVSGSLSPGSTLRVWDARPVLAASPIASPSPARSPVADRGKSSADDPTTETDAAADAEFREALAARHMELALVHASVEDWPVAIEAFRKATVLRPDNVNVNNNAAWFLATCPDASLRDASRAVELARRAVERKPNVGTHWNTLGVALYRAGDWQAAITALSKSNELLGGKMLSFNAFFLAMAHWQKGEKEQARRWYDKATDWMEKNGPKDLVLQRRRD